MPYFSSCGGEAGYVEKVRKRSQNMNSTDNDIVKEKAAPEAPSPGDEAKHIEDHDANGNDINNESCYNGDKTQRDADSDSVRTRLYCRVEMTYRAIFNNNIFM